MDYVRYCLSSNLRVRRAILGISQEELARRANLSSGFIANLETGRNFPSSKAILKIASAMKIDPWKLLVDPQKEEVYYSRDEVDQWLEDSRKRLLGEEPLDRRRKRNSPRQSSDDLPDQD